MIPKPSFANQENAQFSFCGTGDCSKYGTKRPRKEEDGILIVGEGGADWSDADLAKEMNELSVKEREQVFDDIHGVAKAQEETPDFVKTSLTQLNKALGEIPKAKRKALDRAIFLKPSLQNDAKFKLMFLRADNFDARNAANRMTRFFSNKLKLFGEEKLGRDIRFDDLDEQDLDFFGQGSMVELSNRDQTGRPIWLVDLSKCDWSNPTSLFRCSWYLMMATITNDEVAQRRGVCQVVYNGMSNTFSIPSMISTILKSGDLFTCLPVRVTSSHQCYENPSGPQLKLISAMRIAFGKDLRLRMKTHFGSRIEMQYSLLTFGIRCGNIFEEGQPDSGKFELFEQYHLRRVKLEETEQQMEEAEEVRTGIIPHPKVDDVLIGRGSPYHEYKGNIRMSRLIDSQLERYRQCGNDNFRKTCISIDVVKSVEEYGGRFLIQKKEGWQLADYSIARQKAANAFRSKMAKFVSGGGVGGVAAAASNTSPDVGTTDAPTPPWKITAPPLPQSINNPPHHQAKRPRYDANTVPQLIQVIPEGA